MFTRKAYKEVVLNIFRARNKQVTYKLYTKFKQKSRLVQSQHLLIISFGLWHHSSQTAESIMIYFFFKDDLIKNLLSYDLRKSAEFIEYYQLFSIREFQKKT